MWQNRVRNTSLLDSRDATTIMPYKIGRARCQKENRSHSYVRNHICAVRQTTFSTNKLCRRIRRKIESTNLRSPAFIERSPVNIRFVHLPSFTIFYLIIWLDVEKKGKCPCDENIWSFMSLILSLRTLENNRWSIDYRCLRYYLYIIYTIGLILNNIVVEIKPRCIELRLKFYDYKCSNDKFSRKLILSEMKI